MTAYLTPAQTLTAAQALGRIGRRDAADRAWWENAYAADGAGDGRWFRDVLRLATDDVETLDTFDMASLLCVSGNVLTAQVGRGGDGRAIAAIQRERLAFRDAAVPRAARLKGSEARARRLLDRFFGTYSPQLGAPPSLAVVVFGACRFNGDFLDDG